jgi:hypothetical protein
MRRKCLLLATVILALLHISIGYGSVYDLFVTVPNIHIPRVEISYNVWQEPIVRFVLNTPTVTAALMLFGAAIALCGTAYTFGVLAKGGSQPVGWALQIVGLALALIAWIVQINDVLSNAFRGVG